MTSHNDTWESLKAGYIAEVEKALSGVSHPRKKEVLADVQSHLEQRFAELGPDEKTRQNLVAIITEMGPASDYAELLEPDAKQRKRLLPWMLLCVLLLAALVIIAINMPSHPKYGAKLRELFNCNFSANPFFSIANFEQIKPGMAENEVRDLIGYPMRRYQLAVNPKASQEQIASWKDEIHWGYTGFAFDGAKFYRWYRVTFSKKTGEVLKKMQVEVSSASYLNADPAYTFFPAKVGDLEVMGFDGKTHLLSKNDSGISIVVFGGRLGHKEIKAEGYREGAKALLDDVGAEGVEVYYIDRKQRIRILGTREFDFDFVVYKKGEIYSLPTLYASFEEIINEGYREDRRWLIKRLMD